MPLLRYEVGDVVEFEEPADPCPCGRTLPLIRRILGRQEDVVITPDGRVLTTLFIVFNQIQGVSLGQVVQEESDRLVLRVVRAADYTEQSEADLLATVRRYVGPDMRVAVEYPSAETLRQQTVGKFRTVVSRLPRGEAGPSPGLPTDAIQGVYVP
jgi:phenylacetate-CoA ligase